MWITHSKIFVWLLLSFFLMHLAVSKVSAQVVINEVHPNPNTGNDWIELKNISTQSVNLAGWSVEDSSSSLTTSPSLSTLILEASGYIVIEVSNRLNNTGDQVKIKNSSTQLVDTFSYSQAPVDQSWSRSPDGTGPFVLSAPSRGVFNPEIYISPTPSPSPLPSPSPQFSPTPTPTPSISPSPTPNLDNLPTHITLSEIMACPNTGENEWIEIQNGDSVDQVLNNWQIKDSQNNSRYFSQSIAAHGLAVIPIKPAMLNNSGGDQVSVVRPDGMTTSWASYVNCSKGKSLLFNGANWIPAEPTPGQENPDLNTVVVADSSEDITTDTTEYSSQSQSQSQSQSTETSSSNMPQPKNVSTFSATQKTVQSATLTDPQFVKNLNQLLSTPSATIPPEFKSKKQTTKAQLLPSSQVQLAVANFQKGVLSLGISSIFLLGYSGWIWFTWYTKKRAAETHLFS